MDEFHALADAVGYEYVVVTDSGDCKLLMH